MTKPLGLWHYEYVEGRTPGHEWRVGDADDDMVTDFPTEEEAKACVRAHNATVPGNPEEWKF